MPNTYKIGKTPTGIVPKYNLHDFEFVTSTKRSCFVDVLESRSSWNGGHAARDIRDDIREKFGFDLEVTNVSSMIRDLERTNPERIDISRGGGNGQYKMVAAVVPAPPSTQVPSDPESLDTPSLNPQTTIVHEMSPVVEKLLRELVAQLDYQRERLDRQENLLNALLDFEGGEGGVFGKLDYVAKRVNASTKSVEYIAKKLGMIS